MGKNIDRWKLDKNKLGIRGGRPKAKGNHGEQVAPASLPTGQRVSDLRVDGDLDLSIFDDLEPDQDFVVNPAGVAAGEILQAVAPTTDGQPPSWSPITPAAIAVTTDGNAPSTNPTPIVVGGQGLLSVTWDAISNADPVTYQVHLGTSAAFATSGATLLTITPGQYVIITQEIDGTPLELGQQYYITLIAQDGDGASVATKHYDNDDITKLATDHLESDGGTPAAPSFPELIPGPGWIQVRWFQPSGTVDPLIYYVYASDAPGFTPGVGNLIATTMNTQYLVNKLQDGTPFVTGTPYYFRVFAASTLSGNVSVATAELTDSPDELDGEITTITNLDAGNITAGFIDTIHIDANTITGSQISMDDAFFETVNAALIEGQTVIVGDPLSNHVIIDSSGIFLLDGDNFPIVSMPTNGDPAVFTGTLIADLFTVLVGATIQGTANIMDEGSLLTLKDSQGNPALAPQVTFDREYIALSGAPNAIAATQGLHVDIANDKAYRLVRQSNNSHVYLQQYTWSTGAFIQSRDMTGQLNTERGVSHGYTPGGVVAIGSNVFVYVNDYTPATNQHWFIKFAASDLTTIVDTSQFATSFEFFCIGTDGTWIITCQNDGLGNDHNLKFYSPTTLLDNGFPQVLTGDADSATADTTDVVGIVYDDTNDYYWIAHLSVSAHDKDYVAAWDASTGDVIPNQDWYTESFSSNKLCGLSWDNDVFFYIRGPGSTNVNAYSTTALNWTTETDYYHFAYRWHDGTPGTHQTKASAITSVSLTDYRRFRVLITMPDAPSGLSTYPLIVRKSTIPAATELRDQGRAGPYMSVTSNSLMTFLSYNSAGTLNSPDSNTFGAGNSTISATGSGMTAPWKLKGDGRLILSTLTADQRAAISSPEEGLLVHMHDAREPAYFDGDKNWWPVGMPALPYGTQIFEEFLGRTGTAGAEFGTAGLMPTVSSAGATPPAFTAVSNGGNSVGEWEIDTGNGTATASRVSGFSSWRVGDGRLRFGGRIRTGGTRPTTANNYSIALGLITNVANDPTGGANSQIDIVIDRIDDSTTRLRGRVNNGGTAVTRDLNLAISLNTFYTVECEINAAGNSIQFYLDGVATGAAVTTVIPTATDLSFRHGIYKSAGTAARNTGIDYMYLVKAFTTRR